MPARTTAMKPTDGSRGHPEKRQLNTELKRAWAKSRPSLRNPSRSIDDPVLLRAFELAMASHGSCTGCLTIVFPKVDLERLFSERCGKDFLMHPCHESLWMRTMYPWLITIQMLASAEHTCRCYQYCCLPEMAVEQAISLRQVAPI